MKYFLYLCIAICDMIFNNGTSNKVFIGYVGCGFAFFSHVMHE